MRSDAFGCVRMHPATFGKFRKIVYASRTPPRPLGGWRLGQSILSLHLGRRSACRESLNAKAPIRLKNLEKIISGPSEIESEVSKIEPSLPDVILNFFQKTFDSTWLRKATNTILLCF